MFKKTTEPKTAKQPEINEAVEVSDDELDRVTGAEGSHQGRIDTGGYVPT